MKKVASLILAGAISVSVANALPFVDLEAGGLVSLDLESAFSKDISLGSSFGFGGYARAWFKTGFVKIAPFFKYENTGTAVDTFLGNRLNNIQYGGLIGLNIPIVTPYVGAGFSQFLGDDIDWNIALNYGVKVKIPIMPITIGIDGSWQRPKFAGVHMNVNRIGVTLGVQF